LEDVGVIRAYTADLDPSKLELGMSLFVRVWL